ncbi:MAG: ferrous iron transport protein A [Thermoplasmata archaeon]|nr:ferrous iron transport protein A [Thermoplasmata archaeon]
MAVTTLDSVEPGNIVVVLSLEGRSPGRRRLLDMGILPGEEIEVIRRAPLGDPVVYRVKGYNLMMRAEDAALVRVRTLDGTSHPRPLVMLQKGEASRVVAIRAGRGLRRRLVEMGLREGTVVTGEGRDRGRVVIGVGGRTVSLGKGVAMKVMVDAEERLDGGG